MLPDNKKMSNFGRVLTTCIWDKKENGLSKIPVYSEKEYLEEFDKRNKKGGFCEIVGLKEFQVKPYLDIDPKGEFDYSLIDNIKADINEIIGQYTDEPVEIYEAQREPREENGKIKHSIRLYPKARISYHNIPILFKDLFDKYDILDNSIYNPNRRYFLPLSDRKRDFPVPPIMVKYGSILDCCATYIKEDYINLDEYVPKEEEKPQFKAELFDVVETTYDGSLNFTEIMTKLSKDRATDYGDWFYVIVSLINLFYRKIISKGQVYDLADFFSSKADNYDADGVYKVIDTNLSRFNGKGYGIKYLLECLKVDNIEYYKQITKKDLVIDGANDDIGACEIVVNHYRDVLIICKGVLYVNDDDIWVNNEREVDKLLIDMIGKLEILFYGADGKRKYYYNKSIKHIKDCIVCIKANKAIINDKFYDDMMKNNKYYLPFNDGVYSFKQKKLFQYSELPNIHFTYKIKRNFPKFVQKDYDDLISKVIAPIYPIEDERLYNAHIKSRALAGCFEDKKWYGYSGSRNSGKGTETGILRSAFGDYVLEFNARCLIYNKFGNPEPAKALSWVVDKKDARIIISNEIDGDENTKLNGAFIKSLASGGDAMEGRKLYENTISFIPQFTMILCYNRFYDVEPADATENLEQFEYKSKFVYADELIDGIPFLKLKDDTIKEFIKEDRIIDAYTLYILNAFTNPRMKTPDNIKNSTEINNGEKEISVETFIINNFINTNDKKDRLHTDSITDILNNNGYKVEAGKLMNRIGIGKYNKNCSINKIKKVGYEYVKYLEVKDEV